MDKTILECIEEMYEKGEIGAMNRDNLLCALDDYKKAYNKLITSDTRFLVGEEVYTNIDKFNLKDKSPIIKIKIECIYWDEKQSKYIYNYKYTEDELYESADELYEALVLEYKNEYNAKCRSAKEKLKKLEGGDIDA